MTVFPDPGTGATTVDGWMRRTTAGTWSEVRDGAGEGSNTSSTDEAVTSVDATSSTDVWGFLQRSIYTLDTSALTSGAIISGAVFSINGANWKGDTFTDSVALVASTPASDNALINADYSQTGTILYATAKAMSSWSDSVYNDFTMNATGLAAISKTGITKLGIRSEKDRVDDSTWISGGRSYVQGYFADQAGTDADPKLVITYTLGGDTEKSSADTAAGVDAADLVVEISASDAAVGIDAASLDTGDTPKASADTGSGTDAATLETVFAQPDSAAGIDASFLTVELTSSDSGVGVDAAIVDIGISKSSADVGSGADAASLVVEITAGDVGFGVDSSSLLAALVSADSAIGVDAGSLGGGIPETAILNAIEVKPIRDSAREVKPTSHTVRQV